MLPDVGMVKGCPNIAIIPCNAEHYRCIVAVILEKRLVMLHFLVYRVVAFWRHCTMHHLPCITTFSASKGAVFWRHCSIPTSSLFFWKTMYNPSFQPFQRVPAAYDQWSNLQSTGFRIHAISLANLWPQRVMSGQRNCIKASQLPDQLHAARGNS